MHIPQRLTYPHRTGCGCRACCLVDAAHEAIGESVDERIAAMPWIELRGLSHDYRDLCKRMGFVPCSFRQWLRDRVADQLIAKAYDEQRSWY